MATEKDVYELVLTPMQDVFNPPFRCENEGRALAQYAAALRVYDRNDLRAGWAAVRSAHEKTTWPAIATIEKAVRAARQKRDDETPREDDGQRERRLKREANELIRTDPNREQWFKNGIVGQVFTFYVYSGMDPMNLDGEGKIPTPQDEAEMVAKLRWLDEKRPN